MSVAASRPRPGSKAALAAELIEVLPALGQRFQAGLPADVREQMASVTHHQLEVVGCLAGAPQGLSMNDLARVQGCALSTATAMADRLIKQGLVERVDDPADRRVVRLVATPRAIELRARFLGGKRQAILSALQTLDTEEMAVLVKLLRKVAQGGTAEPSRG